VTGTVVPAGMVIFNELQLAPKGKNPLDVPAAEHVIATVPVNPPLGVTVTWIIAVLGVVPAVAVIVPLPPLTVKLPVEFTVMVIAVALESA